MNVSRNYFSSILTWFLIFLMAIGWQIIPFIPSLYIPPAEATGEKMVLLWDTALGGSVPTGWTNASATYGGYFLRGDTVANVGNPTYPIHNHTQGTVAFQSQNTPTIAAPNNKASVGTVISHGHPISTFTMDGTFILPVYRNLIAITCDSGIPTTLPQYAIALFDAAPGTGFSSYSSQNGNMIRIDSTSGGTGGSTTHSHTNLSIISGTPDATSSVNAGTEVTVANDTHTHSYSGTSPESSDHTPLHTEVILGSVTNSGGTAIPVDMIAMFDGDPNIDSSNWDIISDSTEAFYQIYIEAQSSYQTGQGNATHTHTINVSSSTFTATSLADGPPPSSVNVLGTHAHTISGNFSDENNEPPYINVVIAKKEASFALGVTAPTDVTLASIKPSETGETTFVIGDEIIVTDGGSGWSLTVEVTTTLSDGGSNTIPDANVYIRKDGNVNGVPATDVYTIWDGITTDGNVTEVDETVSLDQSRAVGVRSSGTGDDLTTVRPTIQVIADVDQTPADYDGVLRFTVV